MKFLVDANVLSEPTKPVPNTRVVGWLRDHEKDFAISSVALGELEYGILALAASRSRRQLEAWFALGIARLRVLDFDAESAHAWARLLAALKKKGVTMSVKDSVIAATAVVHDLTIATRNVSDFRHAGVRLLNPFDV